ncbi:MAG TPA: hypothetical protein VES96_08855 [Nitrospiraceae bacterium]|nr:hypothetical protein [Nitrospiraceae bacterium]
MSDGKAGRAAAGTPWIRIPNGTRVRHRAEGKDGIVDGLTEIVTGPGRNPDGRTQYRIDVTGEPAMHLAAEDELLLLTDKDGLVLILRQQEGYRRQITERLHATFAADRFVIAK